MSSAAPLRASLQEAYARRLGSLVKQGFGLTETSPGTHCNPDEPSRNRPGSIGVLAPATEARIIDPVSGAELGPGQDGELWLRGPQVMKVYLGGSSETTSETHRGVLTTLHRRPSGPLGTAR